MNIHFIAGRIVRRLYEFPVLRLEHFERYKQGE